MSASIRKVAVDSLGRPENHVYTFEATEDNPYLDITRTRSRYSGLF